MLQKYRAKYHHKMIRSRLRCLGRLLASLKEKCPAISEFADLYNPKYYDNIVATINELAGLDGFTGKYKAPSYASMAGMLIKKVGTLLISEYVKQRNKALKCTVKDFMKLFTFDYGIAVNKTVQENQLEVKRHKIIELPSINDIQVLKNYLDQNRNRYYNKLKSNFSLTAWKNLASYTLTTLQLFNRRRAGEIERILIDDIKKSHNVNDGLNKELYNSLSQTGKEAANEYSRCVIRGKLAKGVPVLFHKEHWKCMKLIIETRNQADVPDSNPYLFGIPGKVNNIPQTLDACVLMREYASKCGASNPKLLRGTTLRKHIATQAVVLNLKETVVSDLANFMGHADKIHKDHYRLPIPAREITVISKLLEMAQGTEHIENNECQETQGTSLNKSQVTNCSGSSLDDHVVSTKVPISEGYITVTDQNFKANNTYGNISMESDKNLEVENTESDKVFVEFDKVLEVDNARIDNLIMELDKDLEINNSFTELDKNLDKNNEMSDTLIMELEITNEGTIITNVNTIENNRQCTRSENNAMEWKVVPEESTIEVNKNLENIVDKVDEEGTDKNGRNLHSDDSFDITIRSVTPENVSEWLPSDSDTSSASSSCGSTTYRANRKVPWKTPERHMGRTIFGKFIKNKNLPSLEFCNDMAKKHFPSRTGKQLKAWVNNQLKRKAVDAAEKVKGLLSWDVNHCLVDLEKELAIITEQALEGEEARYGERLIQFASENLVTEILIHPVVSTLAQCVRNLLSSFTRHRHIIHAGYTFANNGSWTLQDGTFSSVDFSEAFQEIEVLRVIRAYENGISLDIHCAPEGDWTRLPKESFTKGCKIRVNPNDVLTAGSPSISSFISYLEPFLIPAELENILESSDVVGNIRFSRPTLYVFPGGQGDAALFGINGFNMLLDGGFSRKACFWDFVRHLDRLDAVLLTRLNNSNVNGISAVLKRKMQNAVYPQIGHFFCNIQERKAILSPDGDKDKDPLLINLLEEGQEIVSNLRHLSLTPQVCYRDSEPINLYHKVGHGTLDMYVLSPAKESKEVREFLLKWNNNDQKLFANQRSSKDFVFPLQNLVSVCALLVWQPANPEDTITRILFPGSSPQNKIFEGLDKVKNLEFIKHPVCSEKSLAPTTIMKTKQSVLDRIMQPEKKIVDNKKEKSEKTQKSPSNLTEIEMKNGEINGVQPTEKSAPVKKSDSTESEKSISKQRKIIENGEQKDKFKPKPKSEMKVKPRSESQQRKVKSNDKKPSPTTPKKQVEKTNEEQLKAKAKTSPASTPAKSAKEANNRKVVESKIKAAPKKEPLKHATVEKKETKTERKPISRRPKDISKLSGSPSKKVDGVPKLDGVSRRGKLDKEGTTDSSTVSTPSADQDSILKKDISKLTSDELQNMKAQELADLKEEQEAIKEIEAVFRKGELQEDKPSDFRKVKDLSIDDKLENDEYLIIEKTEIEQDLINEINQEEETQKIARDSEESEKQRKLSEEKEIVEKRTELQDEVQKIITSASDIIKAKEETIEASKEVSVTSPEDKIDFSTDKKDIENEVKETAQESQPDEKGSANIESGATTTAPTLPEDERMPLDEIKEDNGDQVIEEKHVKEDTKEKDVPVIQLPPKTFDNVTKLPAVVGIRLDKQSHIRDIVKTPDEVADLPVHEEAEFDHYEEYPNLTEVKSEVDELRKSETGRTGVKDKVTQEKETTDIKQRSESQEKKFASEDNKTLAKEPVEEVNLVPTEKEVLDKEKTDLDLKKEETKLPVTEDIISETKDVVVSEKKETEPVMLQDSNKKEDTKSKLPDDEKDKDEHEIDQNDSTVTKIVKEEEKNSFPVQEPPAIEKEKETTLYNGTKDLTPGHIETEEVIEKSETEVEEKQKLVQTVSESHKDKDKEVTKKPTETESETIEKDENQKLKEDVITIHTIDEKLQKLKDETSEVDHIDSKPTLEEAVHSTKEPIKVREDVAIIEKIDEKLRKLKAETEPQKIEAVEEVVTHKTAEPQHAEPVIIASESPLESPTGDEKKIDDKLAVGQKSPKEREEDVAKIVASVAEVLKSDAPLEEFEGKIPFTIPYTSYTTELRETHITTVDSPISEENKIITSVCPKTSSSYFIEEERKIAPIHEEQEIAENKISKMIKDSNELMEATSKIIQDIKQSVPKNDFESTTEDQDGESGTVHRMLVTASSEDGGEEIEICPPGTITFSKSSESSGRSSPELQSQKLSQKSSITDTVSDVTIITKSAVPSTEKVTEDLVQESQSTTDQPVRDTKKDSKSEKQFIEGTDTSVYEAKEMSELPIKTNEDEKRVDGVDDTEKNAKDNKKDLQKVQEVDSIKEMEFSHEKSTEKDEKAFTVGKSVAKEDLASEELIKEISKISNSEESQSLGTLEEKKIFEEDIEKRLKENMTSVENGEFKESTATESKHVLEAATKHLAEDVTTNGDSSKIEQVTQENIEVLLPTEESTTNAENREKPSQESLICHKKEEFKDDILTKGEVAVEFAEEDKPLEDKSVKIQDETQKSAEFTIANDKKSEDTEEFIEKGTERSIAALKTEKSEAVSVSKGKDFSDKTSEICEETKTVGDATGDNKEETYKTQISTLAEDEKASISTEKTFEESIDSPKTKKSPGEATTVDSSHETNEVIEEGKTQEDGNEQMKGLTHKALDSTLPFGKTTQNLDEVYTTSPEKKIGDECVVKTESEKSVADHTKTKLQTTEKELEQKHTHAQEITDDVSLSIAQDKPEFVESIQEIRPDISGRVESTTENIEKHQTSIEKTVTSSVEDPKDVVAKDGTIATEKRVEEKLQTGVDEQKVEITTKQEKLLESVMNLENIESETNKVELELGDEFMEAKTEKSALSLTDQRETATNIITDETCTKMEETDKQTKNAKDEEKQDLEVCGKVSEKINQLEGNKKILEDANKFGAEVSVAIEEVDNKAETVQDQQESTQNDVKQKQTEEKEKVDHYLKDKKEEVVTGVESLKEDLTKFDSDLNKTAINVISDSPNKEKIDSSHEEKTESSKTVNEFDEKSELCNGLETVEKMVVGVLTADRETTDKAEKEILSGTQKMEKEVENMQKGVEDVKELIDEIKDSVFKHDSEKENILEQAGQNIEKNFEIMKQKITSGTQKMEKEVENIQKEVEDVKELIDKTKDSVFKHDSEKEKILEQAGQDIEKNFEIMSDMTKSVVFETCGVSKDENIKEEEILEKTTRNIEKTYENVLEMAKSTSFEKCDKSADDPKKESFLEKSTHDLETTFETMSEMTKSPVFEKCVKTTDDVKEEEVLEKTMTEMPKSPVFEKCVKTTDDVKKEEVLDKTSDDIEETFEAMTKSLVLEKGDKTVDNHKKQEEFLEKTAENMEKTSETIPEMPKSMFAPSDDIKQPSSDENLENTKSSQISVDKKTDKIPDDVKDTSPETIESSPTTKMLPEDKKYSSLQESYVHQDKVSDYSNTPVSCPELASPEKQKTSEAAPDMDQHSSLSTSASGLSGKISPPATKDESLSGRTSPSLSSDKTLYKEEKQTSSKDLSPKSSRFELRESSSVVSDESKEIDQSFVRSSDKCEEEIKKKSLGEKSEEFLESDSHKFKSEKSQEKVSDKEDVEKVSENEQPNQKLDSKDQDTKESIGQFHINGTAAAHDIDVGKGDFKQKALENEHYDKTSLSTVEIQESVKPLQSEKESEKFTSDLSKSDSQKVSKQLEDKTEINVDSIDSGIETETDSKMKEAEEIKFPVAKENLKKEELLEISETKEVCIAGPSTTSQDISLSPAKHMSEELHLSGKSTPDIAEVEKIKEIEETLKHEKHIVGSSTPPTVPVSPIIKEVSSAQAEDIKTASVKSSTLTTLKDSEIRSNTPGSDDYEIGASTHSDISSGQVSRAPHLLESERIESDEDDDVPGSPMSVTSQVAHSRSSSRYDFDEERMGTKNDPMNTSFYGALPGEGDPETDFEKAMAEHRETRGENFIAVEKEVPSYLYEITKAKYSSSSLSSEQENVSGQTRLDEINKNGTDDVMTASFMSDTLPTDTKKDALDSWGKPFALPSPAPPNDNRGTPKKERKLPSNVSAKNKLNDDKKRAESPSKYKNKKINPIYVDLTYVPHHGNSYYSYVDFFKRIRARYYVFSGIEPSREVYNALLEAKQSWEDKELEVTIIPTYDTDILGYWVAENEELLTKYKIDLSPSASRCTINLQDHETSCSAYRLEF